MNAKEILVHSLRLLENGDARGWCDLFHPRVCKNTFLSCVLQPIAPRRGDFPIIYHDQRR